MIYLLLKSQHSEWVSRLHRTTLVSFLQQGSIPAGANTSDNVIENVWEETSGPVVRGTTTFLITDAPTRPPDPVRGSTPLEAA